MCVCVFVCARACVFVCVCARARARACLLARLCAPMRARGCKLTCTSMQHVRAWVCDVRAWVCVYYREGTAFLTKFICEYIGIFYKISILRLQHRSIIGQKNYINLCGKLRSIA